MMEPIFGIRVSIYTFTRPSGIISEWTISVSSFKVRYGYIIVGTSLIYILKIIHDGIVMLPHLVSGFYIRPGVGGVA